MPLCISRKTIAGSFLAIFLGGSVSAQQPTQSRLLVPDELQLAIMIKTALIAFNNANLTGNYSVLRDVAAPSFREANTPARLADIFRKPRQDKLNIAPIVLLQPKLERKPWINQRNLLRLKGFFSSLPERVHFNLAYEAVGNQWRLFAIGVTTSTPPAAEPAPVAANPPPDGATDTPASDLAVRKTGPIANPAPRKKPAIP